MIRLHICLGKKVDEYEIMRKWYFQIILLLFIVMVSSCSTGKEVSVKQEIIKSFDVPRYGIEAVGGRTEMVSAIGAKLYRIYGGGWGRYEPYPPVKGVHTYTWSDLDKEVDAALATGSVVFLEIHPTSWWASDQQCFLRKLEAGMGRDCPFLPEYAEDFRLFMVNLSKHFEGRINYLQLGAEYDRGAWWSGTNEEYIANLEVFVQAVRSVTDKILIVSNGIANIHLNRLSSASDGSFSTTGAVRALVTYNAAIREMLEQALGSDPITLTDAQLLDVYEQFRDTPVGTGTLGGAVASEMSSHAMLHLLAARSDLFDIFDVRTYIFYKFEPDRISLDMAFLRGLMNRYGWNVPILPTEASGAMLNNQGLHPNASTLFQKVNSEGDPEHATTLAWQRAEQGFEVIRLFTSLFYEGVSGVIWYRGLDDYSEEYAESPYRICGLTYLDADNVVAKPAAYVFRYLAEHTDGFSTVERIASPEGVDMFAYKWTSGKIIYAGWYNPVPVADAVVQSDGIEVRFYVSPGQYLSTAMTPDEEGKFLVEQIDAASGEIIFNMTEVPVFFEVSL